MWRRCARGAERAFRHGLVASFVCLAIAIATGLGGQAFSSGEPAPSPVNAARADASSPFRQLGRLAHLPGLGDSRSSAATAATAAAERALPIDVQQASPGESGPLAVERRPLPRPQPTPLVQTQALALGTRALAPGDRVLAPVTFYYCEEAAGGSYPRGDGGAFCGVVRDGSKVRPGMAACDYAYLGQRFRIEGDPTGRTYVCGDTGSAILGLARDIWFLDNRSGWLWQRSVGTSAVIEILPPE